MASIRYYLRKSRTKDHAHLYVAFSWKRGVPEFRRRLGIEIHEKSWDKKRQRLRDTVAVFSYRDKVHKDLDEISEFFRSYFNNHQYIDKKDLAAAFDLHINPDMQITHGSFNDFVDHYINEIAPNKLSKKTKQPLAHQTIKNYKVAQLHLNEFDPEIRFKDLDLKFHDKFIAHMIQQGAAPNSIGTLIARIKIFAKEAQREGYEINPVVFTDDFYKPAEKTDAVYLNELEIRKLYDLDLSEDPDLIRIRDWAIIGLWTGLRVSDWNRLGKISGDMISIRPLKTLKTSGREVIIPLHPMIREILDQRGMPEEVSSQWFNKMIKDVCRMAGICDLVEGSRRSPETGLKETGIMEKWKLVSSHTCRRSFATNLYKSNFPTISIMSITGHSTESSFLKYIKVTPEEHARKLMDHWAQFSQRT